MMEELRSAIKTLAPIHVGVVLTSEQVGAILTVNSVAQAVLSAEGMPARREITNIEDFKCGGCGVCEACKHYFQYERAISFVNEGFNAALDACAPLVAKLQMEREELKKKCLALKPPDWWTQEFHGKQIMDGLEEQARLTKKIQELEAKLAQKVDMSRMFNVLDNTLIRGGEGYLSSFIGVAAVETLAKAIAEELNK